MMKLGFLSWAEMKPGVERTVKSEKMNSLILKEDFIIENLATYWVDSIRRNIRNMDLNSPGKIKHSKNIVLNDISSQEKAEQVEDKIHYYASVIRI